MDNSETVAIKAHQVKLGKLLAIPEPNWETRGSINYHRDCIRILERMKARTMEQTAAHGRTN
jgi:hypothetical protein